MNQEHSLLQDAAERYFAKACSRGLLESADRGDWQAALWTEVEGMGFAHPLEPAGLHAAPGEVISEPLVLAAAARHAAPLPLAETMLAGLLLREAGMPVPSGPLALLIGGCSLDADGRCHGLVKRVPYAARATDLVLVLEDRVALLSASQVRIVSGLNLANEPRDQVHMAAARPAGLVKLPLALSRVLERAALMRAAQMAAACEQALALAIGHAQQRKQFGKAIASFQAIQHQLALAAGLTAAAKTAVLAAYGVLDRQGPGEVAGLAAAMAKSRAGESAGQVAAICHQVLGAMGFTHEHGLHFLTRRLQAWRSECGSETWWQERIGRRLLAEGADQLWPLITATA